MPKTIIRNVFVAQVCWEAVTNTWPSSSKASDNKRVECVVSKLNEERFKCLKMTNVTAQAVEMLW